MEEGEAREKKGEERGLVGGRMGHSRCGYTSFYTKYRLLGAGNAVTCAKKWWSFSAIYEMLYLGACDVFTHL